MDRTITLSSAGTSLKQDSPKEVPFLDIQAGRWSQVVSELSAMNGKLFAILDRFEPQTEKPVATEALSPSPEPHTHRRVLNRAFSQAEVELANLHGKIDAIAKII